MKTDEILREIDAQIRRLTQARDLITGRAPRRAARSARQGTPTPPRRRAARAKRTISPEGRARIAAAQKRRWAKQRRTRQTKEKN